MQNFKDYISEDEKGIWRYEKLLGAVSDKRLAISLNLEEDLTPLEMREDLVADLGVDNLYLKREDLNVLGSFKSRSLAYQVSYYKSLGHKNLVISSSGNAAICAARYCDLASIRLICFISPETDPGKKAVLAETNAVVIETDRAIRLASYVAAKYKIPNLRPSVDDLSLIGFESIAYEIYEQFRAQNSPARHGTGGELRTQISVEDFSIFTFVTSGSSFIGIYNGFKKLLDLGFINKIPRIFAVQGGAGKLGVKESRRKDEILRIVRELDSEVLSITEAEIQEMSRQEIDMSRQVSEEGLAVFAAIKKCSGKNCIAIMSGRNWPKNLEQKRGFLKAENFEELDRLILNMSSRVIEGSRFSR